MLLIFTYLSDISSQNIILREIDWSVQSYQRYFGHSLINCMHIQFSSVFKKYYDVLYFGYNIKFIE